MSLRALRFIRSLESSRNLHGFVVTRFMHDDSVILKEKEDKKKIKYTTLREGDRTISSLLLNVKTSKTARKKNKILLEGQCLIKEGLNSGIPVDTILFSKVSDVENLPLPNDLKLYKVPYRSLQLWSNLDTCPGIIGVFERPDLTKTPVLPDALPLTMICDNVRDPRNLGTIIRTAAAAGIEKLICSKGCVDIWNPKVLRVSQGAHFKFPIYTSASWNDIITLIGNTSDIYLADHIAVEGSTLELDSDESDLNIDNLERFIEKHETSEPYLTEEGNSGITKAGTPYMTKLALRRLLMQLPVKPYYDLDYTNNEIVLALSGETEGYSEDALNIFSSMGAIRLNIPISREVESLNVAAAISVLLFEIKKQFLCKQNVIK